MKTTVEFLDAVKACSNVPSDYALASVLGITRSQVSKLRLGKDFLGDSTAMRVANVLKIDPRYVVACAHAERAKQADERALWLDIAALLPTPVQSPIIIMLNRKLTEIAEKASFPLSGLISSFS